MVLSPAMAKIMDLNMLLTEEQCPDGLAITQVSITENIVIDPVFISTYVAASTALTIDRNITINVSNAPTFLETVVTITSTVETVASTTTVEIATSLTTTGTTSSTTV
ncbi:hypothetical protein MMC08_006542 [Hypocenomyce scalaris]|nr:hypothetical protein [Hypocenomyce scalaris]